MHSFSPLWSSSVISPWSVRPASTVTPFFACWLIVMRSPKWPSGFLNPHSSMALFYFLMEAFLPLELRLLRWQSKRSQEQGTKIWLQVTRDNSKWYHSHVYPLILDFWNLAMGEMAPYIRCWLIQSIYSPPEKFAPRPSANQARVFSSSVNRL